MKKLLEVAVYSIPKLDIDEFCRVNGVKKSDLYDMAVNGEDDTLGMLFLNRYPERINSEMRLVGENIIRQILKIKHLKISEIAKTYGVNKRMIFRTLKKAEQSSPELYEVYKRFRNKELSKEDEEFIENIQVGEIQTESISYSSSKAFALRTHEAKNVFKTKEEIKEEIYARIADECEDPEEFEQKKKDPITEKKIQNRWKKEQVVMKIFEEECDNNLSLLQITLETRETIDKIMKRFKEIDEEDGMEEIRKEEYRRREEKGENK